MSAIESRMEPSDDLPNERLSKAKKQENIHRGRKISSESSTEKSKKLSKGILKKSSNPKSTSKKYPEKATLVKINPDVDHRQTFPLPTKKGKYDERFIETDLKLYESLAKDESLDLTKEDLIQLEEDVKTLMQKEHLTPEESEMLIIAQIELAKQDLYFEGSKNIVKTKPSPKGNEGERKIPEFSAKSQSGRGPSQIFADQENTPSLKMDPALEKELNSLYEKALKILEQDNTPATRKNVAVQMAELRTFSKTEIFSKNDLFDLYNDLVYKHSPVKIREQIQRIKMLMQDPSITPEQKNSFNMIMREASLPLDENGKVAIPDIIETLEENLDLEIVDLTSGTFRVSYSTISIDDIASYVEKH